MATVKKAAKPQKLMSGKVNWRDARGNTGTGKIVGTYEARGLWYIVKDDVTKANKMFRAGLLTKG
jgi:hypothetical protein